MDYILLLILVFVLVGLAVDVLEGGGGQARHYSGRRDKEPILPKSRAVGVIERMRAEQKRRGDGRGQS